jgi:hypothetical protein
MAAYSRLAVVALGIALAGLIVGGVVGFSYFTAPTPTGATHDYYNNQTVYHNGTTYVNTTRNVTENHWDNTTTYVNTTQVVDKNIYHNETVYVNTTLVVTIPVVNVTMVEVNFTEASMGANYTVPTHENYSLPIGTVTWVQITLNTTMCDGGYKLSVNSPWVVLSSNDGMTSKTITVNLLLGVPYFPGTYSIDVTVSK